jgi:hypothetical protein
MIPSIQELGAIIIEGHDLQMKGMVQNGFELLIYPPQYVKRGSRV